MEGDRKLLHKVAGHETLVLVPQTLVSELGKKLERPSSPPFTRSCFCSFHKSSLNIYSAEDIAGNTSKSLPSPSLHFRGE